MRFDKTISEEGGGEQWASGGQTQSREDTALDSPKVIIKLTAYTVMHRAVFYAVLIYAYLKIDPAEQHLLRHFGDFKGFRRDMADLIVLWGFEYFKSVIGNFNFNR